MFSRKCDACTASSMARQPGRNGEGRALDWSLPDWERRVQQLIRAALMELTIPFRPPTPNLPYLPGEHVPGAAPQPWTTLDLTTGHTTHLQPWQPPYCQPPTTIRPTPVYPEYNGSSSYYQGVRPAETPFSSAQWPPSSFPTENLSWPLEHNGSDNAPNNPYDTENSMAPQPFVMAPPSDSDVSSSSWSSSSVPDSQQNLLPIIQSTSRSDMDFNRERQQPAILGRGSESGTSSPDHINNTPGVTQAEPGEFPVTVCKQEPPSPQEPAPIASPAAEMTASVASAVHRVSPTTLHFTRQRGNVCTPRCPFWTAPAPRTSANESPPEDIPTITQSMRRQGLSTPSPPRLTMRRRQGSRCKCQSLKRSIGTSTEDLFNVVSNNIQNDRRTGVPTQF